MLRRCGDRIGVLFDWTNEPATDSKEEDTRYLLKIGYEFEGEENDWWQ
jgi:hypothetical protein